MFNIGFAELIVVLLVAFLIVGPKDLPKVAQWIARQLKNIARMINKLKQETGWDKMIKDIEETQNDVTTVLKEAEATADIHGVQQSVQQSWNGMKKDADEPEEALNDPN